MCRPRGELVVIDPHSQLSPAVAVAWGASAEQLLIVRPTSLRDALACTELALRSTAVAAVWASLGPIDRTAFQRLLLATKAGETYGALVRSSRHENSPSFADMQLRFDPLPSVARPDDSFLVRACVTRNRHGPAGDQTTLSMNWRTGKIEELIGNDVTAPVAAYSERVAS